MLDMDKFFLLIENGYFVSNIKGIYTFGCEIDLSLSPAGVSLKEYGNRTSIFTYDKDLFNYAYKLLKNNN